MTKDEPQLVELDGRTGEGGGQLVRIACALSAVATVPVRITNVRGNREGSRGGGLKSQHVTAIEYLAKATDAEVEGLSVGSHTLTFRPRLRPSDLHARQISITADSPAASTLLIFQAVFPFLLFACTPPNSDTHKIPDGDPAAPITLRISGGTNVAFSLSFEYLDQVVLPALETAFGVSVARRLVGGSRGWSLGRQQRGTVEFKFRPLRAGETLKLRCGDGGTESGGGVGVYGVSEAGNNGALPTVADVEAIDVSMMVPGNEIRDVMQTELVEALAELFEDAEVNFKVVEDSGAESRVYVLLVARAGTVRWGRDTLQSMPSNKAKKGKKGAATTQAMAPVCASISRKIAKELYEEVSTGGVVDEFLQDQMVIFQALAEGRTSFPRGEDKSSLERAMERLELDGEKLRLEKTDGPIGVGSLHTTTARWVTAQMLPNVRWYNKGYVCEGVGMQMSKPQ